MLRSSITTQSADIKARQPVLTDSLIKKRTHSVIDAHSDEQHESPKIRSAQTLGQSLVRQPNLKGVSLNDIQGARSVQMDNFSLTSRFFENLSLDDTVEKHLSAALSPEIQNAPEGQVAKKPRALPKAVIVPSRQLMDMFDGQKIQAWRARVFSHINKVLVLLKNYENRIAHHQGQSDYHRFLKNSDVKSFVIADLMQQNLSLRKQLSKINPLLDRAKDFPDYAVRKDAQMVRFSEKALKALENELTNDLLIAEGLGFALR